MKKIHPRALLVVEPQEKVGMDVHVLMDMKFVYTKKVAHGEDLVAALAVAQKKFTNCAGIVVRSHVGSFSASRSALVIANVLAAVRQVPIHFVEHALSTPEEVYAALNTPVARFSYEREANITMPKKSP